jgi:hypothetical protein
MDPDRRLILFPSNDEILRDLAIGYELAAADAEGLQVALRKHFPQVHVRPRGLSGERETWYVYRDGHWR